MRKLRYALLGTVAAALVFATTTFAGSGVGDVFNLGLTNSVDAASVLAGAPTTATSMLNVKNNSALAGSIGVLGQLTSSSSTSPSTGVRGIGLGSAMGVWGSSGTGTGVYGAHNASSGQSPAVLGETKSTAGGAVGVLGRVNSSAPGAYSAGVNGQNNGTGPDQYGVIGSQGGSGIGVYGTVSGNGQGVRGYSPYGYGVEGISSNWYGMYAQTNSSARFAVFGVNQNATPSAGGGIFGSSANGMGVQGYSPNYEGVEGYSNKGRGVVGTSINDVGVYGYSGSGSAGYFEGDVHVTGTLYAASKQFRIDDPLDPAHKYLQHTSVESPDMMDIYNGNVTTDARGFATVRLPRWFQALNRTFRYQLTIVGSRGWNARVVKPIAHNRFTIQSDQPRVEVSWQVTGIRHDPYANANRTRVIVPKAAADQGKYVDPQAYGKPRRAAIGFRPFHAGRVR